MVDENIMLIDMEEEFSKYLSQAWLKLSDTTADILRSAPDHEQTSEMISKGLIEFLKGKLENFNLDDA